MKKTDPIESFVRRKLQFLQPDPVPDWSRMEAKLDRSLLWRKLIWLGSGSALLVLLSGWPLVAPEPQQEPARLLERSAVASVHELTETPWQPLSAEMAAGDLLPLATVPRSPYSALGKPARGSWKNLSEDSGGFKDAHPISSWSPELEVDDEASEERYKPYISPLQEQNPLSYSLNVYPNFTFRKFQVLPGEEIRIHRDFIDAIQESEKSGFSLNVGFEVSHRIGEITYLHTGLDFITNTYRTEFDFQNFRDAEINPETGAINRYLVKDQPKQVTLTNLNQFHYLNIPLSISYEPWINDHVRVNMEAGVSYLYFTGARGTTIDYQTLEKIDLSERKYRDNLASINLRLGLHYFVNRKINVGLVPSFRYFTNTIYTSEFPFDMIPYSVGMSFSVQMKLN